MKNNAETIHREITPLNEDDCFLVFDRKRKFFSFPIHFHPEYEINFIYNAKGAKRIVGDHISEIDDYELVMVGSNLYHGWENHKNSGKEKYHEITIQFPRDLFEGQWINKNILKPIRDLLQNSNRGILFTKETAKKLQPKLINMAHKGGFESFIEFQTLLFELSVSEGQQLLTNISFQQQNDFFNSEKIEKIYNYIKNNFDKKIMLDEAAELLNMSTVSFGRLIKQRTGKTFVEFTNEIRLGYATRLLIETNKSVSEICYECGFNNISNFNRTFKKKQGVTPSEFRINFSGTKTVY